MTDVTSAYSRRAAEYAALLGTMDAVHPSDRHLIDAWADAVTGSVLDAGCGPGHWTHHLVSRGVDARGIDLVPEFLDHARRISPAVRFDLGSIDRIDAADGSFGGILSWFSTIHHAPSEIAAPLGEFARLLAPGGLLVLGHFDGSAVEAFDHAVVRAWMWPAEELHHRLRQAGFDIVETHRRTSRGHRAVGAVVGRRRGPSPITPLARIQG